MNFALLAPLGLAALAALAIPIAIHLVRRIELQTTEFAALRWIAERIRPRRRLRFERPWLLLLRLALLALVALLLAKPIIDEPALALGSRVLVAPGADLSAARSAVTLANADWRWLAPGFPSIETPTPATSAPIASLMREADADLPRDAKLAIVVPEQLAGLDGERPMLAHDIDWHIVAGEMSDETRMANAKLALAVRYAPASEPSLKYLRAAAATLDADGSAQIVIETATQDAALPDMNTTLLWLGTEPTPAVRSWIESGGTAIVDHASRATGAPVWRDADGRVLARAEPLGHGRLVTIESALLPQSTTALLDADFPHRLLALAQGEPRAPTRAPASAMAPAHASPVSATMVTSRAMPKPLDAWLALAIAALILVERIVATRKEARA
jgi:hypothetical protein